MMELYSLNYEECNHEQDNKIINLFKFFNEGKVMEAILGLAIVFVATAAYISVKLDLKEGGCLEKILIFFFVVVFLILVLKSV